MSTSIATIDDLTRAVDEALARHHGTRRLAWTVPEVAKSLGTSPDSVRRLIKAGHLPTVPHMGTRQLVPVSALEQFVSAGASTSAGSLPPAGADGPSGTVTDLLSGRPVMAPSSASPASGGEPGPKSDRSGGHHPPAA